MSTNSTLQNYLKRNPGVTQRELAKKLKISTSHMSGIVLGQRRPSPEVALRIEALTGIPFRVLLVGERVA